MAEREIQTHLVKKVAKNKRLCTSCNKEILTGDVFHIEQGVKKHLHSLLARTYCSDCYAKYGQKKLLRGNL